MDVPLLARLSQWLKQGLILLIRGYQRWISPMLPASCRFHPTCSQYAIDAYQRFGLIQGTKLSVIRILKCHPFHPGGVDPVPENLESSKSRFQKKTNDGK